MPQALNIDCSSYTYSIPYEAQRRAHRQDPGFAPAKGPLSLPLERPLDPKPVVWTPQPADGRHRLHDATYGFRGDDGASAAGLNVQKLNRVKNQVRNRQSGFFPKLGVPYWWSPQ